MGEIWTTRYAPKTTSQMIGSRYGIEMALKWLKGWDSSQQKKCALISGPVGCGKTLLARLMCSETKLTDAVVEINASKKRTKKSLQEMEELFKTNTIKSYFARVGGGGRPGCLIADEVDACDQGGLAKLVSFIKSGRIPVICTCGDGYKKQLATLQSLSVQIRMSRPTADQISPLLCSIAYDQKFSQNFNPQRAKALATACNCDVRQSIMELQFLSQSLKGCGGSAQLVLSTTTEGLLCDREIGIFDTLGKLFPSSSSAPVPGPEEADRLHSSDRSLVGAMVAENYPSIRKLEMGDAAAIAESVSMGDVLERKLPGDIQSVFSVACPALLAKNKGGLGQNRFPSLFGNISKSNSKAKEAKAVARAYGGINDPHELFPALYSCLAVPAIAHFHPKTCAAVACKLKEMHIGDKASWEMICYMGRMGKNPEQTKLDAVDKVLIAVKGKRKREDSDDGEEEEEERVKPKRVILKKKRTV